VDESVGALSIPDVEIDLSRQRILVTNDDGINAPGIALLEKIARKLCDDVWVVAPDTEQSGTGHSLTLTQPLRSSQISERHIAVHGTPTDSVIFAINKGIPGKKPTLVLSGINRGSNLGEDVTYSGTVGAAMEGTLLGIPAIALSQTFFPGNEEIDWATSERYAEQVVRWLVQVGWPSGVLMNVNFPDAREHDVQSMQISRQGKRAVADMALDERMDTRGQPYFWIGYRRGADRLEPATDIAAVREGSISITPLHLDLTDFETRDALVIAARPGVPDEG